MVKLNEKTNIIDGIDARMMEYLLEPYTFTAKEYEDEYEGIIMWSNEFDIWGSGKTKEAAIKDLAAEILDFSKEFFEKFDIWVKGREAQIPYLLKAIILNDIDKLGGLITCRPGEI